MGARTVITKYVRVRTMETIKYVQITLSSYFGPVHRLVIMMSFVSHSVIENTAKILRNVHVNLDVPTVSVFYVTVKYDYKVRVKS